MEQNTSQKPTKYPKALAILNNAINHAVHVGQAYPHLARASVEVLSFRDELERAIDDDLSNTRGV